jgi:replicative DNA helicase
VAKQHNLKLLDPNFKRDAFAYLLKDKIAAKSVVADIPEDFFENDPDTDVVFQVFKNFIEEFGERPRFHELESEVKLACEDGNLDDEKTEAVIDALNEVWEHDKYSPKRVKKRLFDAITVHHMYVAATQVSGLVDAGEYDEVVQLFAKARITGSEQTPLTEYWTDTNERLKRRAARQDMRISTGMDALDDLIGGGVPPKALAMLMGASGHGKSALLGQLAVAASVQGFNVGFITLELDEDQIMDRMDAHNTSIPIDVLPVASKKVAKGVVKAYQRTGIKPGALYVQYYPTKSISIHQIEEYMRRLREEEGVTLDALFVDYFGLLKMVGNYKDQWEALGENCAMLRGLAGEYQTAIWTADQTNRGGMNKEEVDMDDISGSFGKVFPLDLMVNISQTKAEKKKEIMRLHIAKTRLGPANKQVWIKPNFRIMQFEAFDEDTARAKGLVVKTKTRRSSGGNFTGAMGTQGP